MKLNMAIAIATYNNPSTIVSVVEGVLKTCHLPIYVFDDGSEVPVEGLIKNWLRHANIDEIHSNRIIVVDGKINKGKGYALRQIFSMLIEKGFTHAITLDGDGQHPPGEIKLFIEQIQKTPRDLIIGVRDLSGMHVPPSSIFGRKFSNFWVQYHSEVSCTDTQSGYRAYPLFFLQNMRFFTKKYDFEIEVMARLLWKGVEVQEIDIKTYYPPSDERVSHFNKKWDNIRISILNTLLVISFLLKKNTSPLKASLAIGIGVLIGCSPLIGLHSFIAMFICLVARLNFPLMFLGTQVSLPFLMPFIITASIKLGAYLNGQQMGVNVLDLNNLEQHLGHWWVGSIGLGIFLGSLTGTISYLLTRNKKNNWTGKSRGGWFGNNLLKLVGKHLGQGPLYFCLHFLPPYFYFFAPKATRSSNHYWKIARPHIGFGQRQLFVLKHYLVFSKVLADKLISNFKRDDYFEITSMGHQKFHNIKHGKNQGMIIVGSHVGGWDIAAQELARVTQLKKIYILQYDAGGEHSPSARNKSKFVEHINVNDPSAAIFQINSLLDQGKTIAILADRPAGKNFELISFFNKLAPFDSTPFKIAAVKQVPILYTFAFKTGKRRYAYQAFGPFIIEEKEQYISQMENYARTLERKINQFPFQWFNFFEFWERLPDKEVLVPVQSTAKKHKLAPIQSPNRQKESRPG